jgi:hypothetical protein
LPALGTRAQRLGKTFNYPVYAGQNIVQGSLVVMYGGNVAMPINPMTLPMGSPPLPTPPMPAMGYPSGYICVGVAIASVNNSAGAAGAVRVDVKRGCFQFANNVSTPITLASIGQPAFTENGLTLVSMSTPNSAYAGMIRDVDANGVWVEI